jgi:hypothetical protein
MGTRMESQFCELENCSLGGRHKPGGAMGPLSPRGLLIFRRVSLKEDGNKE